MPAIAIRQSLVNGLSAKERRAARWVLAQVGLVSPARFTAPGGNVWLIFDDPRIDLRDVAYLGKFFAALASLPNDYTPPDALDNATAAQARTWVRNWLQSVVVWPVAGLEDAADPYAHVLAAQGAPNTVQAAPSVPSTWTPL